MRLLIILSLVVVSLAHAEEEKKPPHFPGGGAADLLNNTKFNPDLSPEADKKKDSKGLKLRANCTDSTGKISVAGDPGFDRCLADKQGNAAMPASPAQKKSAPVLTIGN